MLAVGGLWFMWATVPSVKLILLYSKGWDANPVLTACLLAILLLTLITEVLYAAWVSLLLLKCKPGKALIFVLGAGIRLLLLWGMAMG